jgi:gamma-glutamyltranspeptidase / glutathione hydrolase
MNRTTTGKSGGRPMLMGTREAVSSGHYLATQVGMDVLARGGNAMDAAAAVGFALTVLKPQQNGIGGEVPTLIYSVDETRVLALSGNGTAPREATIEHMRSLGIKMIPGDGFLGALVPPAPATWIALLERFGTMRLAQVLAPAVELAERGFPMYDELHNTIAANAARYRRDWPTSAEVWLPGGEPPVIGSVFRQPQWATTLRSLIKADEAQRERAAGLRAAREAFYQGEIAERIVAFCRNTPIRDASGKAHTGLLSMEDFAAYEARFEEPVASDYRGVRVHKCGPWTQGPVLLQSLNLLEGFDLSAMGHNSADYIHTVVECMKLAYADREFHYGDPRFAEVPLDRLLSKDYASQRRLLVDAARASMELRPDGREPISAKDIFDVDAAFDAGASKPGDTTKLEVIDSAGNVVSATPSGGWLPSSPVIEGLGFPLGTRGQMFSLVADHPNCLTPGKRPRTTLTPSIATRDGKAWMAFGSPGGDKQDQWALQFLLNVLDFGMPLQHAVEAPTFWTGHFPDSFYPRKAEPGVVHVEARIAQDVRDALAQRGHEICLEGDFAGGNTLAAAIDPATNVRLAAASPRIEPAYAAVR